MAANVLIVDDSRTMRQMIRRVLSISGLDIGTMYEAGNGIEAFAQLADHAVDVVLLDINMPVMNGEQFLRRLHDDPRLSRIPVVIASTEGSETRMAQLIECGARGYVRKPFHPEALRDVLTPIIGIRPSDAAATVADDTAF